MPPVNNFIDFSPWAESWKLFHLAYINSENSKLLKMWHSRVAHRLTWKYMLENNKISLVKHTSNINALILWEYYIQAFSNNVYFISLKLWLLNLY